MAKAKNPKFEHNFLDLKGEGMEDRTSLGSIKLGVRCRLFWASGLVSLLFLGVMFVHVDQRIVSVMDDWRVAREVSTLMARTQSGLARAEALEKSYVLDKKRELVDVFTMELSRVGMALDEFYGFPQAVPVRQHIATLRDGVEQYGQQFTQFVIAEEALSPSTNTGVSPRLQRLTAQLSQEFTVAGYVNLADQLAGILHRDSDTLRSGAREGVTQIRERFRILFQSLKASKISKETKENLEKQLQAHQTELMTLINSRFDLERERKHFGEILAYMAPSTDALWEFSNNWDLSTARRLDQVRSFARYSIAGATATVLLWLMFAGILLFRSVVSPLQDLAFAAARLAGGDRETHVPARGNVDATGQIARALDKWIDDMADADMARRELDQVRAKLELTISNADRSGQAETESGDLHTEIKKIERTSDPTSHRKAVLASPILEAQRPARASVSNHALVAVEADNTGQVSLISQQLTYFSEYVTAAAQDVERTETLIRNLGEATSYIEVLGNLMTGARHQVNLLVRQPSTRDYGVIGRESLIALNGERRNVGDAGKKQEPMALGSLDAIRDAMDRAEHTLRSVRASMENINAISHEIAKTASDEALEATNKLLSQSQYLQHMLGDIMGKIDSNPGNRLSSPRPEQDLSPQYRGTPARKV